MRASLTRGVLLAAVVLIPATVARGQGAKLAEPSNSHFVVGDQYTIRAERRATAKQFSGELVLANERWIVLRCPSAVHEPRPSVLARLPVVGRRFASTAIGRAEDYVWIPRQAATVESCKQAAEQMPRAPLKEDSPPRQTACSVQLVHAGKLQQRDGGMEEIDDEQLTISIPKRVKTYPQIPNSPAGLMSITSSVNLARYESRCSREEIALGDVLCVRVTKVDPASLERR
jgi:hypothetical protein